MLERVFQRSEIGGLGERNQKGKRMEALSRVFPGADALMQDELSQGKSNQTPYQEEARGPRRRDERRETRIERAEKGGQVER